ncbi:hypothetical protein MATL_G00126190 [Megalops atlanticus]|uniref:Uncharacterized protein n=1 Tax=Megalops atlanticus TaxID=7932 RepID=A0A9D3T3I8_MEGAT|nr:hypothetical protein MATL_G00126190 [Megalops atlanticus]
MELCIPNIFTTQNKCNLHVPQPSGLQNCTVCNLYKEECHLDNITYLNNLLTKCLCSNKTTYSSPKECKTNKFSCDLRNQSDSFSFACRITFEKKPGQDCIELPKQSNNHKCFSDGKKINNTQKCLDVSSIICRFSHEVKASMVDCALPSGNRSTASEAATAGPTIAASLLSVAGVVGVIFLVFQYRKLQKRQNLTQFKMEEDTKSTAIFLETDILDRT